MLGWIVRILLIVSGFIASFFVTRDALNFDVIQMVVGVFLFTFAVAAVAFWPILKDWVNRFIKK